MNSTEQRKNARKLRNGCRRNRYHGGESNAYSFGPAVASGAPYASEVVRGSACGQVPYNTPLNVTPIGLPGMKGGRYTTTFEVVGPAGIALANPQSIMCDVAQPNTLNQHGPSTVTAPSPMATLPGPGVAFGTMAGGARKTRKSKRRLVYVGGMPAYSDVNMVYNAPRTGYSYVPSDADGSAILADGKTPFAINMPYSTANVPSAACQKTGGARKNSKKAKKTKKAKKARKAKKTRKARATRRR
jgi:putative hemolysin